MTDTQLAGEPNAGHVIVCGANHLARRTVNELRRRGESVWLVAPEGTDLEELDVDARVIVGDQRSDRILRQAGAPEALAVILAAEDDHGNLDAALAARSLNPGARIVIRLFDAELGSHLEQLIPGARVLSSSALAAPGFVSAAVFGDAGERFTLGGRVLVMRGTGGPGIDLDGLTPPSGTISSRLRASTPTDQSSCCPRDSTGPSQASWPWRSSTRRSRCWTSCGGWRRPSDGRSSIGCGLSPPRLRHGSPRRSSGC